MVNEANVQHASRFIFSINVYKYKRRTERHLLSGLLLSSHLNMFRWGRLRAAAVNEQDEGTWKCSSTLFNQVAHQILMQLQKVLSCDRFSAYLTAADLRALLKLSYTHTHTQTHKSFTGVYLKNTHTARTKLVDFTSSFSSQTSIWNLNFSGSHHWIILRI